MTKILIQVQTLLAYGIELAWIACMEVHTKENKDNMRYIFHLAVWNRVDSVVGIGLTHLLELG